MMLEKYCKDNGYKIYDTYVDDGYTGLNFDRPAFKSILVALCRVFNLVKDDDKVIEIARKKIAKDNNRGKQLIDKSKIEKRLVTLTAVIRKLYEDYVTGLAK
ncbi:MAG: hypothetical protein FWC80_04775 [Firmicutes bacterium]|nr:hypothetical protein [Bacillota bacterium]